MSKAEREQAEAEGFLSDIEAETTEAMIQELIQELVAEEPELVAEEPYEAEDEDLAGGRHG